MVRKRQSLGDSQAIAFVRVGGHLTSGMADTGSPRTIMDAKLAKVGKAEPTGRRGTMNIAGHKLKGQIMRAVIGVPYSDCSARVNAFVPDPSADSPFKKGLLLGMDFLQKAKMVIDAETGTAFCPRKRTK